MRNCPSCSKELDEKVIHCVYCGQKLVEAGSSTPLPLGGAKTIFGMGMSGMSLPLPQIESKINQPPPVPPLVQGPNFEEEDSEKKEGYLPTMTALSSLKVSVSSSKSDEPPVKIPTTLVANKEYMNFF